MAIESVKHLSDRTVVSIHEPVCYGEADQFRQVVIPHDPSFRTTARSISRERVANPLDDPYGAGLESIDKVIISGVGTVVFVNQFDTETNSATYRQGAHAVDGPYLLEE